jgi:hypothetical protein
MGARMEGDSEFRALRETSIWVKSAGSLPQQDRHRSPPSLALTR